MLNRLISEKPWANTVLQLAVVVFASICFGFALNVFLIPGNIYSSGVTGIAQLITFYTNETAFASLLTTGNLNFLLNIPLIILSFYRLGRTFTLMSLLVVAGTTISANLIPIGGVSENPLLNAIMGGVISGLAGGLTIKVGMSSGGMDIVSVLISKMTGMNIGSLSFIINLFVMGAAGLLFGWEFALYTLISIYVGSRVVDSIHTNEQVLTAFIVTNRTDEVMASIFKRIVRGATILEGQGGYSKDKRDVVMVVVNRYEIHDLQIAVAEADPDAFVNMIQSTKVSGRFLSRDQQKSLRKEVALIEHEAIVSEDDVAESDQIN